MIRNAIGIIGFALAVVVGQPRAFAETDPVAQMEAVLKQRRALQEQSPQAIPKSGTAADELFALPSWKDNMAQWLADKTMESRVNASEVDLHFRVRMNDGNIRQQAYDNPEMLAMLRRVDAAETARHKISAVLRSIEALRDSRTVPLVAPLLAETSIPFTGSESNLPPPQDNAHRLLNELVRLKVIERPRETNRFGSSDLEHWRRWWAENRAKFDPVPESLRAIDEGRAGVETGAANATPKPAVAPKPELSPTVPPATVAGPSVPPKAPPVLAGVGTALALVALLIWLGRRAGRA